MEKEKKKKEVGSTNGSPVVHKRGKGKKRSGTTIQKPRSSSIVVEEGQRAWQEEVTLKINDLVKHNRRLRKSLKKLKEEREKEKEELKELREWKVLASSRLEALEATIWPDPSVARADALGLSPRRARTRSWVLNQRNPPQTLGDLESIYASGRPPSLIRQRIANQQLGGDPADSTMKPPPLPDQPSTTVSMTLPSRNNKPKKKKNRLSMTLGGKKDEIEGDGEEKPSLIQRLRGTGARRATVTGSSPLAPRDLTLVTVTEVVSESLQPSPRPSRAVPETPKTLIIKACIDKDLPLLKEELEGQSQKIKFADFMIREEGKAPLHYAVMQKSNIGMVAYLLDYAGRHFKNEELQDFVDVIDFLGWSPLHHAA